LHEKRIHFLALMMITYT